MIIFLCIVLYTFSGEFAVLKHREMGSILNSTNALLMGKILYICAC